VHLGTRHLLTTIAIGSHYNRRIKKNISEIGIVRAGVTHGNQIQVNVLYAYYIMHHIDMKDSMHELEQWEVHYSLRVKYRESDVVSSVLDKEQ